MGGRIGGESPREEKIADLIASNSSGGANQVRAAIGDMGAHTGDRHRSRQQLMARCPLGQHEFCDASE